MTPLRGVLLIFMLKKVICLRKPQTRQKHWRTRNGCFIKGELFSLKKAIVVRQQISRQEHFWEEGKKGNFR